MALAFSKYSGCGNSFILIDNRRSHFPKKTALIKNLCHPHHGIGGDGLILVKNEWSLTFYNSDGKEAEMCGNGLRCAVHYITNDLNGSCPSIITAAGTLKTAIKGNQVSVEIPLIGTQKWNISASENIDGHFLNTGVPHFVTFVDNLESLDIASLGHMICHHPLFSPSKTNANFAQKIGKNRLKIRTFERGVNSETLACGTGATATALAAHKIEGFSSPVEIEVQSNEILTITFSNDFGDISLTGSATKVFEGIYDFH